MCSALGDIARKVRVFNRINRRGLLAERQGFEPWVPSRARRISSAVLSTTQPPLREMFEAHGGARSSEAEPLAERDGGHKRLLVWGFAAPK